VRNAHTDKHAGLSEWLRNASGDEHGNRYLLTEYELWHSNKYEATHVHKGSDPNLWSRHFVRDAHANGHSRLSEWRVSNAHFDALSNGNQS